MGEYATRKSDRATIKIGTMEEMYYLRADQVNLIEHKPGNYDTSLLGIASNIRFRFPFPWEDKIAPGDFDDYDASLPVRGADLPEEFDHSAIQFRSQRGILVSLPCPESKEGRESGLKFGYNGYAGKLHIVQQRLIGDQLVLVCKCGSCGSKFRLPTLEDAQPVIDALLKEADEKEALPNLATGWDPKNLREVARRIVEGYTRPNFFTT